MIRQGRHSDLTWRKGILFLVITVVLSACGNEKDAAEQSVFNQRKVFKETFHEANSEKMIGHYEKAIELFEKCLVIEAENPAVHFALSDLYEKQGDEAKTLSHAEQAYELNTKNKWYILRLADLYFAQEKFDETANLYGQIIEDEKNIDLKFKYVEALIRANRNEEAISMLNEIEVETGKIPEVSFTKYDLLVQSGKRDEAEAELQALMDDNPTDSDYKIMVAEFYMQQGDFIKSKKIVQSILDDDPEYGQAYIMMADLHLRQDDLKGTFSNLSKGFKSEDVELDRKLEILRGLIPYTGKNQRDYKEMRAGVSDLFDIVYDPNLNNGRLHEYYGFYWLTQENFERAEKEYQLACDLDPSSFNTWLQLLSAQKELGNYSGMFANGKKAADLFPAQPIIYLLTGIGAKESKEFEAAEEWFFLGKDLVVKDPQLQSEFLYQLGDMNYMQGNPDEGKFYFDQAIQTFPGNVNVYAENAKRLLKDGKADEAETEIKKGIAIAPKSVLLLDIYGQILFEKKEYSSAADAFAQALYDNYFDGILLERYGDALFLSGKKGDAFEIWSEAIKQGNDSPLLKRKLDEKNYIAPE